MLYRISAMFVAVFSAGLILGGCGGNVSLPGNADLPTSVEPVPAPAPTDADPELLRSAAYVSPLGMELHRLDNSGFPCDPVPGELSVEETQLDNGQVEWRIIDNFGTARPVFTRVRFGGTTYGPETIERGDWDGEQKIIFAPFATAEHDLDLGICPVNGKDLDSAECRGRAIARLVFEPGAEKTWSIGQC